MMEKYQGHGNCAYNKVELHTPFLCVSLFPTGHCSITRSLFEGVYHYFMGTGSELRTLVLGLWGKNKHIVIDLCLLKYFWIFGLVGVFLTVIKTVLPSSKA